MKTVKWIITILVLVLLIAACGRQTQVPEGTSLEEPEATASPAPQATAPPEPETQPTPETEIEPTQESPEISQPIARWNAVSEQANWVLTGYGDALNPTVVQPGTYVTINFSPGSDQVNGWGGCNNYFASYHADDDYNLTINGPVGSTMMACETGMDQESMFLGALETVTGYKVTENGELLLDYDSGTVYAEQLVFVPEAQLVDTHWVLTSYGDPNNPTPSKPGMFATAFFSVDGTLKGSTGCNNYVANYVLQGDQILVNLPVTNLAACGVGTAQEQAFMQGIEAAQSYRLGVNALEIATEDGVVLRFGAQQLPLENVRWLLAEIDGQAIPEGVSASVVFIPASSPAAQEGKNTVNGSAGCNTFFGDYSAAGDTLTTGPFGLTRMMCEEPVMQVEYAFLAGLEAAQDFQISSGQLIVNTANGSLLFYADRLPLEGPLWILTGSGPVDNPQPPIEGGIFTTNFSRQFGMPSGTKSGATGCRDYTATYSASFDRIKVNLPQTSGGACSDVQLEAEQGYFLGLNAARDYRILGNELYVYYDNNVLIFVGNYPAAEVGPLGHLDDTEWWLRSIDNTVVVPGSRVTILFEINPDGRTGRVSGSGGCNTYSADVRDVFVLGPIIASTTSCDKPEGVMQQEGAYLTVLQNANGVSIDGDILRIMTDQETLYFNVKGPEPVRPIPSPTPAVLTAVIIAPGNEHVGEVVTYDASLSTPSGEITSYRWWFTDGSTAEGVTVERTYKTTGAYDAILTVTDAKGQNSEASVKVKIHTHLIGTLWVREGDATITLSFDGSTLSGFAGCNNFSADYTSTTEPGKTNDITIGSIRTTAQTCDKKIMEKEQDFLADLEKVTSFKINITDLILNTPERVLGFNATP